MCPVRILAVCLVVWFAGCSSNPESRKTQLLATGDAYYEKGKFKEASLVYRRALSYDARFAPAYYRLGLAALALGRYWEAMQAFERAAGLEPGNPQPFEQLADLYLTVYQSDPKRFAPLLDELEARIRRAEENQVPQAATRRVRGFLEVGRNNLEKGVEFLLDAHRHDPADQRVVLGLAGAWSRLGRFHEAERLLLETLERQPAFEAAYDGLYELYLRQNQTGKAAQVLVRRSEKLPASLAAHLRLAEHLHRTGQPEARDRVLERVAGDPATFPEGRLAAGDFCLRLGLLAQAERYYRSGAELDNAHSTACRIRLAHLLAYQARFAEALKLVDEMLRRDANDIEARHLRGALLLHTGDRDSVRQAIAELEALAARDRSNPVLRYNLGRAYLAAGDVDKAIPQLLEAVQVREYLAPRYELGRAYLAKNQPELAAQLASEILEIHPASLTAAMLKATALLETKNFRQAREILEGVLRRQPASRQAQFLLAKLDLREQRFGQAEPVLRRLWEAAPLEPHYWWSLSQLYLAQGRIEKALEVLDRSLRAEPLSPELLLARATVAANARRFDEAIRDFRQVITLAPKDARAHERLGTTHYFQGDPAAAEACWRKALELDRSNTTAALRLALLYGESGRAAEAIPLLRQVLEAEPDHPVALNNLAHLLAESSADLDEALRLAQKAYQRAPGSPTVAGTLGSIYLRAQRNDEAIQLFEQLGAREPNRAQWRMLLGQAYLQKGDFGRAAKELERALAARPGRQEEARIRELLEQARR